MHEEYWFPSSWYLFGANVSFHFTVNATEWIRMYNFGMQSGRWQIDSLIKIRLHFSIWVKIIFDSCRALVTNKYLLLTLKPFDDWIKLCNCNMLDKMVASDSMFNVQCSLLFAQQDIRTHNAFMVHGKSRGERSYVVSPWWWHYYSLSAL